MNLYLMSLILVGVLQTAVLSCAVVVVCLFVCRHTRATVTYYLLVVAVIVGFAHPILTTFHHRHFIAWLADYLYADSVKVAHCSLFYTFLLFISY